MIGHFLLTFTPDVEHDVLTRKMQPGAYEHPDGSACLVGVAAGIDPESDLYGHRRRYFLSGDWNDTSIEYRYDCLCARFGTERVNRAIRNRVLANIARRTLIREAVAV